MTALPAGRPPSTHAHTHSSLAREPDPVPVKPAAASSGSRRPNDASLSAAPRGKKAPRERGSYPVSNHPSLFPLSPSACCPRLFFLLRTTCMSERTPTQTSPPPGLVRLGQLVGGVCGCSFGYHCCGCACACGCCSDPRTLETSFSCKGRGRDALPWTRSASTRLSPSFCLFALAFSFCSLSFFWPPSPSALSESVSPSVHPSVRPSVGLALCCPFPHLPLPTTPRCPSDRLGSVGRPWAWSGAVILG